MKRRTAETIKKIWSEVRQEFPEHSKRLAVETCLNRLHLMGITWVKYSDVINALESG
jgi:hypothetical protein